MAYESRFIRSLRIGAILLMLVSVIAFIGGTACTTGSDNGSHDDDPTLGETLYTSAHVTAAGQSLSCEECHGADGSGGPDPDIRESSSSHLQSHAQGGGTHPDGVKYPDLTREDFDALAEFLGGTHSDDDGHDDEVLVGDAERGQQLFTTPLPTLDGVDLDCSNCHRQDGAGAGGPSVVGQSADHLEEHAQGEGGHPEGIKYPELTAQDFADMAAFLENGGDAQDHE